MNKMMMIGAACAAFAMMAGCGTPGKMRDIQLKGMYVNGYSEVLAIGSGRLTSIPGEREAFAAHYEEDTAWLSPNIKTHKLDLFLVGTNTVDSSAEIVSAICKAFAEVAPSIAQTNAEVAKVGGTSPLDVVKGGGEVRKAVQMAKVAANATQTAKVAESATQTGDVAATAATAATECANGTCGDNACAGGACADK